MTNAEFFTKALLAALPIAATRAEAGNDNIEDWSQRVALLAAQIAEHLCVVRDVQLRLMEEDAEN